MSNEVRKSLNALSHGVFSEQALLPWEKSEDFSAISEGVQRELDPQGVLEHEAVFDVIWTVWLKRRLRRGYQMRLLSDPLAAILADAKASAVPEIVAKIQELSSKGSEASVGASKGTVFVNNFELKKLVQQRMREIQNRGQATSSSADPNMTSKDQGFKDVTNPSTKSQDQISLLCDRIDRLDDLEQMLRSFAVLSSRQDKALAALVRLKEYKRLYASGATVSNLKLVETTADNLGDQIPN